MAIQTEIWAKLVEENLFASFDVLKPAAIDDSGYISKNSYGAAKVVHIPNAGTPATISKNPTLPLSVGVRTDNDHYYDINLYAMNPVAIPQLEAIQLSYDKTQSVVNDMTMGLAERIMAETTIAWYTDATYKVLTTGGAYTAHAPNATGTRKGLTTSEVKAAAAMLDLHKVPQNDRFLIVDSVMWYQLLDEIGITSYRDAVMGSASNIPKQPLYGFQVIVVPSVAYCTSTYTVKAYGATGAATDQAIALAVHKSALSYAFGGVQIYTELSASYLGDVISGAALAGAKYRRADKKGVVPIIQAATS